MISFLCSRCATPFEAPKESAGRGGCCPNCGNELAVTSQAGTRGQVALRSTLAGIVSLGERVFAHAGQRTGASVEPTAPLAAGSADIRHAVNPDIERQQLERALSASEDAFRSLLEHSPEAIFLMRPDGTIVGANRAACAMFRMSQDEVFTAGRAGIFAPADPIPPRVGVRSPERFFMRKNGERFRAEVRSSLLRREKPLEMVVVRDLTEPADGTSWPAADAQADIRMQQTEAALEQALADAMAARQALERSEAASRRLREEAAAARALADATLQAARTETEGARQAARESEVALQIAREVAGTSQSRAETALGQAQAENKAARAELDQANAALSQFRDEAQAAQARMAAELNVARTEAEHARAQVRQAQDETEAIRERLESATRQAAEEVKAAQEEAMQARRALRDAMDEAQAIRASAQRDTQQAIEQAAAAREQADSANAELLRAREETQAAQKAGITILKACAQARAAQQRAEAALRKHHERSRARHQAAHGRDVSHSHPDQPARLVPDEHARAPVPGEMARPAGDQESKPELELTSVRPNSAPEVRKICVICSADVSNMPRLKDAKSRYCCRSCYEALKARQREARNHPRDAR